MSSSWGPAQCTGMKPRHIDAERSECGKLRIGLLQISMKTRSDLTRVSARTSASYSRLAAKLQRYDFENDEDPEIPEGTFIPDTTVSVSDRPDCRLNAAEGFN